MVIQEHLLELVSVILSQFDRPHADEVVVIHVASAGGEVHRSGPDLGTVDDDKLVMHQTFLAITQHLNVSFFELLYLQLVQVVAIRDHTHNHTSPVGFNQRIPHRPQIEVVNRHVYAEACLIDGSNQGFIDTAPVGWRSRIGWLGEVYRVPIRYGGGGGGGGVSYLKALSGYT